MIFLNRVGSTLILLLFSVKILAQESVSGKVVSQKGEPLAGANVYIPNSAIGTITDAQGSFTLNKIPQGNFRIAVSFIGYEIFTTSISSRDKSRFLDIILVPRITELDSVTVRKYVQNGWSKWGNTFTAAFIGESPHALKTTILNPGVIRFAYSENKNELSAFADEPIIIENRSLGYKISVDLEDFLLDITRNEVDFQVYSLFTALDGTENEIADWKRKRKDAYAFSMMHFMRALYANELSKEGFEIQQLAGKPEKLKPGFLSFRDLARKTDSGTVIFSFKDYLIVTYKRRTEPKEYYDHRTGAGKRSIAIDNANDEAPKRQQPTTLLTLLEGIPLEINENGYFRNIDLMFDGFWGWWEKLATKLPYDYLP